MLPGNRGDALDDCDGSLIACRQFLFVDLGKQHRVVVDDGVANEARALIPYLLLRLRLHAELACVDIGDGPAEAVVGLPPVEGLLHALP